MGGKGREGNWGGSSCVRSAKCIEVEVKQLNSRLKKKIIWKIVKPTKMMRQHIMKSIKSEILQFYNIYR